MRQLENMSEGAQRMNGFDLVPATAGDFRRLAEKRLPRMLFDYVDGAAGAEVTAQENIQAFANMKLRQRVLRDVSGTNTQTQLLGETLAMPVILAPVGMAGMMARRGEAQAKRVADRIGIPFSLSTVGICPVEEISQISDRPAWFQLYMLRDRGIVSEILERAWQQGVRTLIFTVDLNVVGTRYRDIRNGVDGGTGLWGRLRSGPVDYLLHPRWLWDVALHGGPLTFGSIAKYAPAAKRLPEFKAWVDDQFDPSVNWKDIEWLRGQWKGKLILKGILDRDDARDGQSVGADALVISNHGGRQLDSVASGAQILPAIADDLGGALPLIVDGGIRSGQDVVKALALGAQAVMIGRPWIYALAAQGEAGLERLLRMFEKDMRTALGLTGFPDATKVDRSALDA